jgi:hypothetical protein
MLGISPSTLYRRLRDYNLEGRLRQAPKPRAAASA